MKRRRTNKKRKHPKVGCIERVEKTPRKTNKQKPPENGQKSQREICHLPSLGSIGFAGSLMQTEKVNQKSSPFTGGPCFMVMNPTNPSLTTGILRAKKNEFRGEATAIIRPSSWQLLKPARFLKQPTILGKEQPTIIGDPSLFDPITSDTELIPLMVDSILILSGEKPHPLFFEDVLSHQCMTCCGALCSRAVCVFGSSSLENDVQKRTRGALMRNSTCSRQNRVCLPTSECKPSIASCCISAEGVGGFSFFLLLDVVSLCPVVHLRSGAPQGASTKVFSPPSLIAGSRRRTV